MERMEQHMSVYLLESPEWQAFYPDPIDTVGIDTMRYTDQDGNVWTAKGNEEPEEQAE